MKAKVLAAALFILAVFAAFISHHLVVKHVAGTSGASWFEAGCSDSAEPGAANCAAVLASPYAYFPPKHEASSGRLHLPVALLGLLYYTTIALWAIGIGVPSRSRAWLHGLMSAFVAAGVLGSIYFVYVMFVKMGQWCPWCAVTHAANALIAVGVVLMWPLALRREGTATSSFDEAIDTPRSISLSKPSALAVLLTTLAIIGFSYAHWNMFAMKHWRKTADSWLSTCRASLSKSLLNNWWQQPEHQIPSRPDDPVRRLGAATGQPVNIVIFSDFECPSCQRFAEGFEKQIVPLFTQPVSVTFKHYPLDQACNQFASRTLHAHACQAARWAEAARITGGNDAFWRAHDFLFAHREDLATGQLSVEQFAEALGFDAAAITQQAERIAVTSRITEDVAAARGANVIGTPAVFVEGKAIDQVARGELAFWQGLVDVLTRRGQAAREFSLENK